MTVTALQCAQLSAEIYAGVQADWAHWWDVDGVVCAHRKVGADDVLVFRGSLTAQDWIADADAFPTWDRELGFLHRGFLDGLDAALEQVQGAGFGPLTITGHSLGGARARIAAAKLLVRKQPVAQVVVFGSPKPGFANCSRVIQKGGITHLSYRNRNDPVPLVPMVLPQWQHPEQWIPVDGMPDAQDFDCLRDHSSALYVAALAGSAQQSA